jgi:signal recognition particle subunit SRP54
MFESLTKNLGKIFDKLRNRGTITESDLDETMREVRIAFLEADVSLSVIKDFISQVREKAIGQGVVKSISPGQMIIKIINDELINFLKSTDEEMKLNLHASPPVPILLAGLQGSGKTTSAGKLALFLKNQKKSVFLVSTDIYRPAAREQLKIIADKIGVDSLPIIQDETVDEIIARSKKELKTGQYDVVIYDTAGRLHIDSELIDELKSAKDKIKPNEILLVIDSLTGQDAVNVAKEFNEAVGVTGVILTRIDGDGRGGAALSVKHVTKAPIKFVGVGEKLEALEPFVAERIASRILGKGDIVSLVEKAIEVSDQNEMEKIAKRMQSGKFDLNDYSSQLKNIEKLGGISSIMGMLPGMSKFSDKISPDKLNDKPIKRQIAIISSMTKLERRNPDILNASRKKRVAKGSGVEVSEINKLLKQYLQISSLIKKTKNMDPKSLMRSLKGMV